MRLPCPDLLDALRSPRSRWCHRRRAAIGFRPRIRSLPLPGFGFALLVLGKLLPAEFPRVDLRPDMIQVPEPPGIEVQLTVVDVAGLQVNMDVGVCGVLVDRGDHPRRGEGASQILIGHRAGFRRLDVLLEGEHRSVVGARLTAAAPRPAQLVRLPLGAVLLQLVPQLAVVGGVADVLRVVPRQDCLPIARRRRRPGDVARMSRAGAGAANGETGEDASHQEPSRPVSARRTSLAAVSAVTSSSSATGN